MNSDHSNDYSYLDQIRINEGAEKCRSVLYETFRKDSRRAVALLNDQNLMFPSLYILRDQIEHLQIQRYLNPRNIIAMRMINQVRGPGRSRANDLSYRGESTYPVLKWILETGAIEEIPEDDYEEVMDLTVSVLINIHGDKDILPLVANLIFRRNRNGRYIHDLVWALFQARDPQVLKLIAEHMQSSNTKDTQLAAELLNIDQTDVPANENKEKQYTGYLNWLEENKPYLYFTEESFQYASKPAFSAVDLERKYLQKGTPSYNKEPIPPSDEDANKSLAAFKQLSTKEQKILSEYSKKIYDKSVPVWKEWLREPLSNQIEAAKIRLEGDE